MARQKKIVRYVPNTKIPDTRNMWNLMWKNRANYTLESILKMGQEVTNKLIEKYSRFEKYSRYGDGDGDTGFIEYFNRELANHSCDESNWREESTDRNGPKCWHIRNILNRAWSVSSERQAINDAFMAEYNSREDLQQLYHDFFDKAWAVNDQYGNQLAIRHYYHTSETDVERSIRFALVEPYRHNPLCFEAYFSITGTSDCRQYIEKNRETPFEVGDIVRLRDPYVGHSDHDPLFVTSYERYHEGKDMPGREVPRLGILMKITDNVSWRGSVGTKMLEVMWNGQEQTTMIQEKRVKWMERPTRANGLLKQ